MVHLVLVCVRLVHGTHDTLGTYRAHCTPGGYGTVCEVDAQSVLVILSIRAQLCLSESLAAQAPKSPFRRAPSSVVSFTSKPDHIVRLPSADVMEETTEDILKVAKHDLSRLKLKEHRKRVSLTLYEHIHMYVIFYYV